jgi:hypothetical protein
MFPCLHGKKGDSFMVQCSANRFCSSTGSVRTCMRAVLDRSEFISAAIKGICQHELWN